MRLRLSPKNRLVLALATSALFGALSAGCGSSSADAAAQQASNRLAGPDAPSAGSPTEPPSECHRVEPDTNLQTAVDRADKHADLCLGDATYQGPVTIETPVRIWGTGETIIRNADEGSTFKIAASGTELHSLSIVGSGSRYTEQDAGVFITGADDIVIENVRMRDVLFGISAQKARRLTIRRSEITCRGHRAIGMRGDGIRFWEVRRSIVAYNDIHQCRDLVVWYAPGNYFVGNRYTDGRYGTHFMYSSRNIVRDNVYTGNSVGIFVMYSQQIQIDRNVLANSGGSSGMGIGLKESGNLEITRNLFANNVEGTYIDASPLQLDEYVLYGLNDFQLNDTGIVFHSEPERIDMLSNTVADNATDVRIQGGGHARDIDWTGNFFSRYAGYDMNGDGVGDIPFELRSLGTSLTGKYPTLKLLHGTPAMGFIEAASHLAPMYEPQLLLKDPEPQMQPPTEPMKTGDAFQRFRDSHGILKIEQTDRMPIVKDANPKGSDDY